MKIFNKNKNDVVPTSSRRRPTLADNDARRSPAFSYYARRSNVPLNTGRNSTNFQSEQSDDTSSTPTALSWVFYVAAGALVVGVISMLSLGSQPKVVIAKDTSAKTYYVQDPSVYAQTASRSLGSSLANQNKITVDTAKIVKDLKESYPEIDTVTIAMPFVGTHPVITVKPHRPSIILTANDSSAYLVAENGRALASTSQIHEPSVLAVPIVHDASNLKITAGAQALPNSTVIFIEDVVSILRSAHVEVSKISLPEAAGELDVAVTGKPYFVKYNLQGEVRQQAGTYLTVIKRLEKDKITPGQYIDVRVPERAYYK